MAFLSARASKIVQPTAGGSYLNPSKVPSGGSVRFRITSKEALDFYECWGTNNEGKVRPYRFCEEPLEEDILAEMGNEFTRRENREGTGYEAPKQAIAFQCYNFETDEINIAQFSQKSLIAALDRYTQMDDYASLDEWDFILGKTGSGLTTEYQLTPAPTKKDRVKDVAAAVQAAVKQGFDINRLLTGENPFAAKG